MFLLARRALSLGGSSFGVMHAAGLFLLLAPFTAEQASTLEHPAIREVVSMIGAGVGEEVIVARIEQMKGVPVLTGEEIAALKAKGASDGVLLALIRAASATGTSTPASSAFGSTSDPSAGSGTLRVVIAPSFPVTYYEVAVDELNVATRGALFEGESEPGRVLKRPQPIKLGEPVVVHEAAVEPGEHSVLVGFAVSRVEEDPNDEWMEYSRQRYSTSGVRAKDGPGPGEGWSSNRAALCRLEQGQLCVVTARFEKRAPSRFGGLPIYSVTYELSITPK